MQAITQGPHIVTIFNASVIDERIKLAFHLGKFP
jgi:hypothetical protein